jgi:putative membrane protein
MDFATTDLLLAIAHHMLVFSLVGILAFEIAMLRPGITDADLRRVARVDIWYGVLAGLILIVGFARIRFAAKGWDYYTANPFFWAKMASFAAVGLLSVPPTMAIIRWRRALPALPDATQIAGMRRLLWGEAVLFGFIVAFAATMARFS